MAHVHRQLGANAGSSTGHFRIPRKVDGLASAQVASCASEVLARHVRGAAADTPAARNLIWKNWLGYAVLLVSASGAGWMILK